MATGGADSCWSWVIATACCWVTFVIQGLVRCGGVAYIALIESYGITRAQALWPFTLRMAVWNLTGPLAGALSYRWSIRTISFVGVLLVTITNIACWFVKDMYLITLFLGGFQGLGVGLAVTLIPVIINQYFVKYKSTGAGIVCAGATAGSFALPPVVEFAIEEYGLDGAFLMMAGITLHGILGASFMRPAEWLSKKPVKIHANTQKECQGINSKQGDQNLNFLTKSHEITNSEETKSLLKGNNNERCELPKITKVIRFSSENERINDNNFLKSKEFTKKSNAVFSDKNAFNLEDLNKGSNTTASLSELMIENSFNRESSDIDENYHPEDSCFLNHTENEQLANGKLQFIDSNVTYDPKISLNSMYLPSNIQSISDSSTPLQNNDSQCVVSNYHQSAVTHSPKWQKSFLEPAKAAFEIIKNPMFLLIACNYSIFFLSYMTYLIIIVDFSHDLGINRTDCVFFVSIFSIADLIGRLGSGWVTDSGIVQRKHLMMGNMTVLGGLLIATSFAITYAELTAVCACTGLVVGVNLIIFYALLEEYLGLQKLPMAIGLMNFSIGVLSLITPFLTGYFRDTLGSYFHLFHFLGSVSVFCGLLWLLEPVFSRCKNISSLTPA